MADAEGMRSHSPMVAARFAGVAAIALTAHGRFRNTR